MARPQFSPVHPPLSAAEIGLNHNGDVEIARQLIDVNDLPALRLVGWPVAVADAHPDVVAAARVVLSRPGGHGAVRELADRVIAASTSPVTPLPAAL